MLVCVCLHSRESAHVFACAKTRNSAAYHMWPPDWSSCAPAERACRAGKWTLRSARKLRDASDCSTLYALLFFFFFVARETDCGGLGKCKLLWSGALQTTDNPAITELPTIGGSVGEKHLLLIMTQYLSLCISSARAAGSRVLCCCY